MKPRAIVIGLDSVPLELIVRFAKEGAMPNVASLMRRGAANRAVACIPAWTPTNWATLATGAWPGTHGAANWHDVEAGQGPGRLRLSTFDSRAITADTIWEAAERQGLRSLVLAYPGSSPSRLKRGLVVAPLTAGLVTRPIAPGREYAAGDGGTGAAPLTLTAARGWRNLPRGIALEAAIPLTDGRQPEAIERGAVHLLLTQGPGQSRPVAVVCQTKNAARPLAEMRVGEWGEWIILSVGEGAGRRRASVRFKLEQADLKKGRVSLIRSEIHPVRGFTEPAALSKELVNEVGPYLEHPAMGLVSPSAYHPTVYEELRYQVDWQVKAASYLLRTRGWEIFYNHWHFPDNAAHQFLGRADPKSPAYDRARAADCLASMREVYRIADRLVGGFMKLAGPETYIVVVADHGNAANRFQADLPSRLAEVGLLARDKQGQTEWRNTKTYYLGGAHIYLNLARREPRGAVRPGDYERVQEEIIDALYEWRDPETGERAVAVALKKKDAGLIGHWGKRCGDVVFVYNPGFAWGAARPEEGRTIIPAAGGANHGPQIPTASMSLSSNLSAFIIAGPGVKPDYRRDEGSLGFMRLVDVVPTLCHLLGITPPRHSQGCVLYDLLK
jgi:predicted AlkP superfamily phosphohydrolase/phosphomutase